jgi:hypothetical protein
MDTTKQSQEHRNYPTHTAIISNRTSRVEYKILLSDSLCRRYCHNLSKDLRIDCKIVVLMDKLVVITWVMESACLSRSSLMSYSFILDHKKIARTIVH